MGGPGKPRRQEQGDKRLRGQRIEDRLEQVGVLNRGEQRDQFVQRQQKQAQADEHPPQVAAPPGLMPPEQPDTDKNENRRQGGQIERSEEHTSELQSLMRISYA